MALRNTSTQLRLENQRKVGNSESRSRPGVQARWCPSKMGYQPSIYRIGILGHSNWNVMVNSTVTFSRSEPSDLRRVVRIKSYIDAAMLMNNVYATVSLLHYLLQCLETVHVSISVFRFQSNNLSNVMILFTHDSFPHLSAA